MFGSFVDKCRIVMALHTELSTDRRCAPAKCGWLCCSVDYLPTVGLEKGRTWLAAAVPSPSVGAANATSPDWGNVGGLRAVVPRFPLFQALAGAATACGGGNGLVGAKK